MSKTKKVKRNKAKRRPAKKPQPKLTRAERLEQKVSSVENDVFRRALLAAKGYTKLAEALEVTRQSVHKWDAIPDRFAVKVEELFGIPRHETAPHLYR